MESWQQFILQMVVTLVPVAIALVKQNDRIARLEEQNKELHRDNVHLQAELAKLQTAHTDLQARYEATLRKQAGWRETF
jgi:prefoldin subunit 5